MAEEKAPPKKGGDPAAFVQEYGPIAERIGAELGVDPKLILAQFGLETGWGKAVIPGTYNLGNIKDPSGKGPRVKDKREGSNDAYMRFEDPEVFADYYIDFMKRMYPKAVGAGSDVTKFTAGLNQGVAGPYATAENYPLAIRSAYSTISNVRPEGEQVNPFDRIEPPSTETLDTAVTDSGPAPERSRSTEDAPTIGAAVGVAKGIVERGADVYKPPSTAAAEEGLARAQDRFRIAQERLANPPSSGVNIADLEAEFQRSQSVLQQAERELGEARARAASMRPGAAPAPAAPGGGGGIPTDVQNQRVQLGSVDEAGTTGRQRMGFNERTAAEAARRAEVERVQQELVRKGVITDKNVLAEAPGMTTTKGGIQVPASAVYEDELAQRQADARTASQRAAADTEVERLKAEQKRASIEASQKRRAVEQARRAEQQATQRATQSAAKAEDALTAAQLAAERAQKSGLSNLQKVGKYAAKAPVLANVAGGLGAGLSVDEAVKRYQAGDYSGSVLATIEAALATASMAPPVGPVGLAAKGVGTVGGLAMIPVMIAHDYFRKRGAWAEPEKATQ